MFETTPGMIDQLKADLFWPRNMTTPNSQTLFYNKTFYYLQDNPSTTNATKKYDIPASKPSQVANLES